MKALQLTNPEKTSKTIIDFLKKTYQQANKKKAVIAVSGGIDSSVSLTLLTEALGPSAVYPVFLPFQDQDMTDAQKIVAKNKIPQENCREIPIGDIVKQVERVLFFGSGNRVRLGNIMARTRMIAVFDVAKTLDALVCGTENKSEHYLGYFTRFGDGASDVEPILTLYKTQVRQLAEHLQLPKTFLEKAPSAGLWTDQTDEKELGFSYEDADKVLHFLIDKKQPPSKIKIAGVSQEIVKKVVDRVTAIDFKHHVPYTL